MLRRVIFRPRLELAIGADLTEPPWTWEWLDMADPANRPDGTVGRLFEESLSLQVGKRGEAASASPTSFGCDLDNRDGWLTPGHPLSPWYGMWGEDTPARLSIYAGSTYVLFDGVAGSLVGTPNHASLQITGDTSYIVELWPPVHRPPGGANFDFVGRQGAAGNRGFNFFLNTDGLPWIRWSPDGTAELDALSTVPLPNVDAGPLTVAVWLDVDNGAGGRTTRFYAVRGTLVDFLARFAFVDPDIDLLDEVTDTGTTSVFASTAALNAGDINPGGFSPYPGAIRRIQVRAGDPVGPERATPDFTTMAPGDTQLTDSTGKVWTVAGGAVATNAQVRATGEVASITPVWKHGDVDGLARAQITVAGITRRMRQGSKPLKSTLFRRITAPDVAGDVVAYLPMEDGRDATQLASPLPGGPAGSFGGAVTLAGDSTLPASAALPTVAGGQGAGWSVRVPPMPAITSWRFNLVYRAPTLAAADVGLFSISMSGTVRRWVLAIDNAGFIIFGYNSSDVEVVNLAVASDDLAGGWVIADFTVAQNGGNIDYGATFAGIDEDFGGGLGGAIAGTVGHPTFIGNLFTAPADGISFGHLAVTTGLPLDWLGWGSGASVAWAGETAAERLERLAGEEGIVLRVDGDPALSARMGPQRQLPLLTLMEDCAKVDMGVLAELRHEPGLSYRTRNTLYNQQPRLTVDAGLQIPFQAVSDDQRRRNDRTVTRPDGSSHREVLGAVEAGTKARYDDTTSLNVESDHQLGDLAGWLLHLGTWPEMRYPSLGVKLAKALVDPAAAHLVDDWLSLVQGDLARVTNLPAEHPTASVDQLVEGWTDAVDGQKWDAAMSTQPAGPWTVGVLEDEVLGRCDTDGSTLASGVDGDDTSWSVTSADAAHRWIDSATFGAMFPFDVMIAGERATVTAITGTGATQTFTATRSVNDVVKAHDAGTALSLADPWRLAL